MRSLLPHMVCLLALVALATGGEARAQGAKDAPPAEDPAVLLEQASAAYEGKDYLAALAAARRSAELAPGKDSVLAYQIWLAAAEQVGDLDGMSAALDAYAAVPGLGKSSVAIIDKARPRLEFYQAEQAGRVDAAAAALERVRKVGAPDPSWLKMAERRLDLRKKLVRGEFTQLVNLAPAPSDSLGQQGWVRAVRGEAVGMAAQKVCKQANGLAAVGDALAVLYRTPEERRRLSALQVRLRAEEAISSGEGDPVALSKALEPLGDLSPEDRVWMARVAMRAELDADWAAGHYGEVLDLREHYLSLATQAPVEPECLSPKVWIEADEATYRAKEADAIREEEERRKATARPVRKERDPQTGKVLARVSFIGGGAALALAGASGGLLFLEKSRYTSMFEDFTEGGRSYSDLEQDAPVSANRQQAYEWTMLGFGAGSVLLLGCGAGVTIVW